MLGCFQSYKKVKICLIFLAIVLVSAGLVYGYGLLGKIKPFFTVVVDCGSTGTRVNVYEWGIDGGRNWGLPILLHCYPGNSTKNPLWKNGCEYHCMQTEPGLDRYVGNYSGLRTSLVPLLRWAEQLIPKDRHGDTPVFVLATAGLRRLAVEDGKKVVFEADKAREDSHSHLLVSKIGPVERQLMAYSLPAFESLLRLVGDPNWDKCKILTQAAAMNLSIPDWSEPRSNSSCQRRSLHEGKNILNIAINTRTDVRYHALSGFFAVYNMLNLTTKSNLTKIWETAQHLCSSTWDDESKVSISQYCFKVLYLASLIEDGLCLGNADIIFGPGDISWTLGASLVEGEHMWRTGGFKTLITTPQYMEVVSSPIFLFIILLVLVFVVYHSQIKLPMPRKRSAAIGAPLSSYPHSKHRP
ncbi:hypothetical protein SOVF_203910 [Spinacia oleracea]|nr:hypothetical protein SOVF_203910 [Spinacia oleracea]